MKSVFEKVSDLVKQAGYFGLQNALVSVAWLKKLAKIRLRKFRKCSARKELDKAGARLGSEVYSLYKQGQTDWSDNAMVKQFLKVVEDTESGMFRFDEDVERIKEGFQKRKQELVERYTLRRAQTGREDSED